MAAAGNDFRRPFEFKLEIGREKRFDGGAALRRFQVPARSHLAVLADGQEMGVVVKMGL